MPNIQETLRQEIGNIGRSLNAITTTQDASEVLGEPWVSTLKNIHEDLNQTLASMPPTEQAPAANEAHWSLMALHRSLLNVQNMIRSINGMTENFRTQLGKSRASWEAEQQVKITGGELLRKEDVEGLVTKARTEGDTTGFSRGLKLGDRKAGLALCGLAAEVISGIPESVMSAEDKDFETARDKAKERLTKLGELGITHAMGTAVELAWAPDEAFEKQLTAFKAISDKSKGNTLANAPATPPINPMAAGSTTEAKKPFILVC